MRFQSTFFYYKKYTLMNSNYRKNKEIYLQFDRNFVKILIKKVGFIKDYFLLNKENFKQYLMIIALYILFLSLYGFTSIILDIMFGKYFLYQYVLLLGFLELVILIIYWLIFENRKKSLSTQIVTKNSSGKDLIIDFSIITLLILYYYLLF